MMRILLVEDERNFGTVLKNELAEESYAVDHSFDGVDAVQRFIKDKHDIVLMDLRLPRLQGVDAIKIIRSVSPAVPVIAFSGRAGKQEQDDAVEAGAECCLAKPFEVVHLVSVITKVLDEEGGKSDG